MSLESHRNGVSSDRVDHAGIVYADILRPEFGCAAADKEGKEKDEEDEEEDEEIGGRGNSLLVKNHSILGFGTTGNCSSCEYIAGWNPREDEVLVSSPVRQRGSGSRHQNNRVKDRVANVSSKPFTHVLCILLVPAGDDGEFADMTSKGFQSYEKYPATRPQLATILLTATIAVTSQVAPQPPPPSTTAFLGITLEGMGEGDYVTFPLYTDSEAARPWGGSLSRTCHPS